MAHARTLRFAVTTSLLAVPVLAGCKPAHTNEGPQEPVVNEGPQDAVPPPTDTATPEPAADGGATPDATPAEGGGGEQPPAVADGTKPKVIVNPGPTPTPTPKP